ncbi:hypothetical protein B0F90DRAFT_1927483 [Multifurca ochricompacta]|uniref:Uncharacterized protein n=1 Tax=Multifurca ochricompacta TaxID=376703 RepID=A0AAD4LZ08_9AGAM|nr:hypothetical protein B0F90DRAFT_1927483 [Multifurca ochricompacta]
MDPLSPDHEIGTYGVQYPRPPPDLVNDEEEYESLVHWKGYPLATTPDVSPEIRSTLARTKNLTRPSAQNIHQTCRTPRMSTPKTLATNTSTDNETRIRRISAAPTPPPTPAPPNEDPISNDNPRIKYRPDSPVLPTPRPCQSTTDRHRYTNPAVRSRHDEREPATLRHHAPRQKPLSNPTTPQSSNFALPTATLQHGDALHQTGSTPRLTTCAIPEFGPKRQDSAQRRTIGRSPAGRGRRTKANRIAVQTIRTSTQALTRRNVYHRIYPTEQAHKIHAAPGTARRLARRLDNTRRPSSCTTTGRYSTTTRRPRAPRPRTLPPPTFNDVWGQTSAYRRGNVTEFSLRHY